MSGYVVFILGCPVIWKSRQQQAVALSSSEAELYALCDAAKEIKFMVQLLRTMHIAVRLPMIVRVDNMGAIHMANNLQASSRSKHIDLRTRFIHSYVNEGIIEIKFVHLEENLADIFTKNTTGETHNALVPGCMMNKGDLQE